MKNKTHNLSLIGKSGIYFGILSILFIWLIRKLIFDFMAGQGIGLLPISFVEIIISVITSFYIIGSYFLVVLINKRNRKKEQLTGWESNSKKIRNRFAILLVIGGVLSYILLHRGMVKLIIPLSLFLYALGCIIVVKFSKGNSYLLGSAMMLGALLTYFYPSQSFIIWGICFGILHIVYGIVFKIKSA